MVDYLRQIGVGQRSPRDTFFDETYKTCKTFVRKGVTIVDDEELCHEVMKEFSCNVPGCMQTFETLVDFEIHYNGSHRYICSECKKSRPSSRLLDIHIQERHDSFFKVLADRQPMYQCYVSECTAKFKTPLERRDHCVTVHKYPKHFRFDEWTQSKHKGSKKCNKSKDNEMEVDIVPQQLLKSKKPTANLYKNQKTRTFCSFDSKALPQIPAEVVVTRSSVPPMSSTVSVRTSSLSFIPRQVTTYSKLLTKAQSSERDVLDNGCMMDIAESLPD